MRELAWTGHLEKHGIGEGSVSEGAWLTTSACDESRVLRRSILRVPIPSDGTSVFEVQDRIEDRLMWQARRKCTESRGDDETQFHATDSPMEYHVPPRH